MRAVEPKLSKYLHHAAAKRAVPLSGIPRAVSGTVQDGIYGQHEYKWDNDYR